MSEQPLRLTSPPPPSYPDSIATFDPEAQYADSDTSSQDSRDTVHRPSRRFSEASSILPPGHFPNRNRSSSTPHHSQTDPYLGYLEAAGLPTPPFSQRRTSNGHSSSSGSSHRPSISPTHFTISETDDPAVRVDLFPSPPSIHPLSAYVSPLSSGRSPTSPQYEVVRRYPPRQQSLPEPRSAPYTCVFEEYKYGSMILSPPRDETDRTPLYIIDVHPNCFIPTSYITTISRGNKEFVARFEMGISRDEPSVCIGQKWYLMKDIFIKFRKVNTRLRDRWTWSREGVKLHWDCRLEREVIVSCYSEDDPDKLPLARLIPASSQPIGSLSTRPPTTSLEIITPQQSLVDDIFISALIVERKRLSPTEGTNNKEIFN